MTTETTETKETVFDDGSKIVETVTTESEYIEGEGSVISEIPLSVAPNLVTDNEVIIASIEADKEVAIAEINAEARVNEAEAYSNREGETWQTINLLTSKVETLEATIAEMRAEREFQPPSSEEIAEILEGAESSSTPQFIADPTNETPMEAIEKSEEESLIPPILEVGNKPIIRLV